MTLEDLKVVANIESVIQSNPWTEGIFRDCLKAQYPCFVIEREEAEVRVGGYIIGQIILNECHILNIGISPDNQRKGLGYYLLFFFLSLFQDQCQMAFLEVRKSNYPAIYLYEKLDFEPLSYRKDYYQNPDGSREDAIVFVKRLDSLELFRR